MQSLSRIESLFDITRQQAGRVSTSSALRRDTPETVRLGSRFRVVIRRGRSLFIRNSSAFKGTDLLSPTNAHEPPAGMSGSDHQFDPATMAGLSEASHGSDDSSFDIFEWYPRYQSCQRYFVDYAQHSVPVQALSAFLNIQLPFQKQSFPVFNSSTPAAGSVPSSANQTMTGSLASSAASSISLIPYIRRLVATGMDFPGVLHGFFGDDWTAGVGPLHEHERRNYLFAAKSGGWAAVKKDYDMGPAETVPFLRPLQGPIDSELEAAERSWSEWLAMEDWMVGPRFPDTLQDSSSSHSRNRTSR
ncbi:conserved hypothetical protein [Talaromyces stipitatus ATCC 10500]|uniref:Ilp is an apoptosis inhibitor n=1 Tax=Talaromyces stipitatus (strain ATCC 10500 / CBS 375.48 / QM 6759 / NRRL 1006) TaxID=441959 RepID=B8LUB7_TALSN|nr:uncharacterized protein TSTA_070950 [Talaromyces stipitatus ATCC 10500]EED23690.1 conserved hypothetical protein [Talaromyces stipitatus ATCC 10500]